MTTVCLTVLTIAGSYCVPDAAPVGDCAYWAYATHCTVDLLALPARASYYDPAAGGINCYLETCDYLGDGTPTAESYGLYIACPPGLYGSTITFDWVGTWQCRDEGGAVVPGYGRVYTAQGFVETWYITFDFVLRGDDLPPWVYSLVQIKEIEYHVD